MGAMLYDTMLIIALFFATGFLVVPLSGDVVSGPLFQIVLLAEVVFFYGYCWRASGETLGMRAWHIRLVNDKGVPPSWQQIGIRMLTAPISIAACGFGYLWLLVRKEKQTWHDAVSNTWVVHIPRSKS